MVFRRATTLMKKNTQGCFEIEISCCLGKRDDAGMWSMCGANPGSLNVLLLLFVLVVS